MIILAGVLCASYLAFGTVVWLKTALESIGQFSEGSYSGYLKEFSSRGSLQELVVSLYVFLFWPVHLTLKGLYKS